ncbi:MAG: hypothetical protein H6747_03780 [Deltaproteobacteria bacterium]|nr:hypothetical protein [Deltaproteobacteria bacterium]
MSDLRFLQGRIALLAGAVALLLFSGCLRSKADQADASAAATPAPAAAAAAAAAPAAADPAAVTAVPEPSLAERAAAMSAPAGADREEILRKVVAERAAAAGVHEVGDQIPGLQPERMAIEMARIGNGPGELRFLTPDQLIRKIRNVAANHNLPGLERYMTPELIERTRAMMPEHAERFWRHLDRYVTAGSNGFELERQPGADEGVLELTVKAAPDIVLRPVVRRTPAGWRFDRF